MTYFAFRQSKDIVWNQNGVRLTLNLILEVLVLELTIMTYIPLKEDIHITSVARLRSKLKLKKTQTAAVCTILLEVFYSISVWWTYWIILIHRLRAQVRKTRKKDIIWTTHVVFHLGILVTRDCMTNFLFKAKSLGKFCTNVGVYSSTVTFTSLMFTPR